MTFPSPMPRLAAARWLNGRRAAVLGGALLFGMAAAPQPAGLAMLDTLDTGQWMLADRDSHTERSLCVTDWRRTIQLRPARATCSRYTIEDMPTMVRVHFSCGAAGSGQTVVRRETSRLVQIESQGFDNGTPFSDRFEARYTGPCSSGGSGAARR